MDSDQHYMQRAIALGQEARIQAPPNPWVGCVIVKDNKIIGEGCTQPAGQDHAEVTALKNCSQSPEGATMYVTLEPCCHFGKTPPCTDAVLTAKLERVVVSVLDPDPQVSGQGLEIIKQAGLKTAVGIAAESTSASLAPYLFQRTNKRAYCVAKAGISLDGRIAAQDNSSKWITSPEARADAHRLRAESQAILIGATTALCDLPKLTVRDYPVKPPKPPLRVILDPTGKVPPHHPLLDTATAPTLMIVTSQCPPALQSLWREKGADIEVCPLTPKGIDLHCVLEILAKRGIVQLLIEGGGKVLGSFLRERLINKFVIYHGPCILGDQGVPVFVGNSPKNIQEAPKLVLEDVACFGQTVRTVYSM